MTHSVAQWSNSIMMQMPRGDIWSRDLSGLLYKYAAGYAPRLQRAEQSAEQLLSEMRPNSTKELLESWEEYLGLPECVLSNQTFEDRRRALIEKYYRNGALQSWAIEDLAATLGYTVEVNEIFPHHCLRSCTYPLHSERYRHVIQVTVKNISNSYASCLDNCLTQLVSESAALLNCTLNKFKLAGKYYEFIYEDAA